MFIPQRFLYDAVYTEPAPHIHTFRAGGCGERRAYVGVMKLSLEGP